MRFYSIHTVMFQQNSVFVHNTIKQTYPLAKQQISFCLLNKRPFVIFGYQFA